VDVRGTPLIRSLFTGALIVALFLMAPAAAGAHCVEGDKLQEIVLHDPGTGDDTWKNFDFTDTDVNRCGIDWPINLVFWNNSSAPRVKTLLSYINYDTTGGDMYEKSQEWTFTDPKWEHDSGVKKGFPCTGDAQHLRIYGSIYDWENSIQFRTSMYDMEWGYYNVATSHIDHHEGCGGWSGQSEQAEHGIGHDIDDSGLFGNVNFDADGPDGAWMANNLETHVAADGHHLQSDAFATKVKLLNSG
jgi:hypothetical protein